MNRSMTKTLSLALSFAFAATTALVGCSVSSDDIYTTDEQRPGIGAIARDEVTFPLAYGTPVPNAYGRATPLTRTMQGVRVEFYDMVVLGNCEPDASEPGEFYYQIDLNGRAVARRDGGNTISAREGEAINVAARRVFFVEPGEVFDLNFGVSESDGFMNGKDDFVGARRLPFTTTDLERGNFSETLDIGSGDCKVQAPYSLTRVQ